MKSTVSSLWLGVVLTLAVRAISFGDAIAQEILSAYTHERREAGPDAMQLKGLYNTSEPGRVWMAWGEQNLDRRTEIIEVPAGNGSINPTVRGLVPGNVYQYAMVAENSSGTYVSFTRTFRKRGQAGYAVSIDYDGAHSFRTERDQREFFPTQTVTAELWVKPERAGAAMSEMDSLSGPRTALVEILPSGEVMARFVGLTPISIGIAPIKEWSHIALRYDHFTQQLHGWVNGAKSPNVSTGPRLQGTDWGRAIHYVFARGTPDGGIGTGDQLIGDYDEVRLWSVARTDEEIERDFRRILYGNEPGLKAYYRCDVRGAMYLTDHSGNNNGAIVQGQGSAVSGATVTAALTPIQMLEASSRLQFIGTAGSEVRLQSTRDFQAWESGPSAMADAIGVATFDIPITDTPYFYRAEPSWPVEPPQL